MKFILRVNDKTYVLTSSQLEMVVDALADAVILDKVYLGAGVPEPNRWKEVLSPPPLAELNMGIMDEARFGSLQLITKLHNEGGK